MSGFRAPAANPSNGTACPSTSAIYVHFMTAIRTLATACAAALAFAGCGGSAEPPPQSDEPPPRGADLVVGTSIDDWTLLSLPAEGGVAELRALSDPPSDQDEILLPPRDSIARLLIDSWLSEQ